MRPGILVLVVLSAACYTYVPMEPGRVQPGDKVRMRVSASTAEQVEPLLGRSDARLLSGLVVAAAADTFVVQVPTTTQMSTGQTLHQRLSIPRTGLLEVESRTLNRTRTSIVAGAATVVATAIVLNATVLGPGRGTPPGGGGPLELVLGVRLRR